MAEELLITLLQHCLSPEQATRQTAEARLGELNAQPGFAAALAHVGCSGAHAVELRQMALSVLKGFVNSGAWLQPILPPMEQESVHALLLDGLSDPTPRVRTAIGAVIGRMAKDEWPERWPQLIPALVGHVQSGSPDRVAGALRCVQIFADDISDSQLPAALDGLWPTLHQVLQCDSRGVHQRFRARAMAVTHSLLSMLRLRVGAGAPGSKEQLTMVLEPCLAVCLDILRVASSATEDASSVGHGVQIHTLRTITLMFQSFPKSMTQILDTMLPELLSMMRNGLAVFEAQQVRGVVDAQDIAYDSDGTPLGFEDCVVQLLELIGSLVESPRLRKALVPWLNDVVGPLIGFTQVTEDQLAAWNEDLNQYVLDEGDESFEFNVRLVAQHVLREISRMFGSHGQVAIGAASQSLLEQGDKLREAGSPYWWKCREAGLLGLGILAEDMEDDGYQANLPADLADMQLQLAQQLLAAELAQPAEASHPCLYSRCLVAAAQGCQASCTGRDGAGPLEGTVDTSVAVLEVVGRGLSAESPMIKLAACRAVNRLIPCLKDVGGSGVDRLAGFALPLLASLCSLLPQAQDDMLYLLFDSMIIAVGVNAEATATMEPTLTPLLLQVWCNNLEDPLVPHNVLETIGIMTQKADCAKQISSRLLPQLCAMLAVHDRDVPQTTADPRDGAVDMLTILVRNGGCDLQADDLAKQAFLLVTRLGGADGANCSSADHSVLQNAAECVRLFVQRMPRQLTALTISEGVTGLHRCVAVVSWLLSTHLEDSAALQVGSLVTALIRHCGHILESVVTSMLRALVTRLRTAHFPSLIQELLVVLAHIVNQQGAVQAIEFLWTCEPEGAGLRFVMSLFIENLPYMIRPYHIKVCCAALGAVCATKDARVSNITVDITKPLNANSSEGVASRTRSKGGVQTISVPFPQVTMREMVRALGQQELAQQERAAAGTSHFAGDDDEEYDEEDSEDDELEYGGEDDGMYDGEDGFDDAPSAFAAASDFAQFEQFLQFGQDHDGLEDDEDEDDPDDVGDPIYHTELKVIIGQYARVVYDLVGPDAFGQECSLLTDKERVFLQSVLVTTAGSSN